MDAVFFLGFLLVWLDFWLVMGWGFAGGSGCKVSVWSAMKNKQEAPRPVWERSGRAVFYRFLRNFGC